jgi:hypothetical protein
MKRLWWLALGPGCLLSVLMTVGLIAAVFVIALFVIKLLWAWTIPDLFPGAVDQGLIVRSLGWIAALKLALFVAVLAGIAGVRRNRAS